MKEMLDDVRQVPAVHGEQVLVAPRVVEAHARQRVQRCPARSLALRRPGQATGRLSICAVSPLEQLPSEHMRRNDGLRAGKLVQT